MRTGTLSQAIRAAKAALLPCLSVVVVLMAACGGSAGDDGLDPDFLSAVATAEALDYRVYWLGEEFTAGGLVFTGPDVADFGDEVEGGGVQMTYLAPIDGGNTGLRITVHTRNAWSIVEDRITNPRIPGEDRPVTRQSVVVGEREAELLSLPLATREVNQLWLILDVEEAVVVATTGSGGPMYTGGPDYNPFINNPDLFIAVLENLRPYPE